MRRTMAAMLLAISLTGCAKVVVVQVPKKGETPLVGEGVFYALPKTVAKVTVKADKTVVAPAPYARFVPIFVPGSKPPCGSIVKCAAIEPGGSTTAYSLQQGATFSTFGEPDADNVFMVKFTGGGAVDQKLSMTWNEAGLLSAASAEVTNRTVDIVVSGVKATTSLATALAGGGPKGVAIPDKENCDDAKKNAAANDKWIIPILLEVDSNPKTNLLVRNYCDLPPVNRSKDEDSRDDFNQARDEALLGRAVVAYQHRLKPLVDRLTNLLLSEELNLFEPGQYIARVEKEIETQVKALFLGSETTKTWELPFEIRTLHPDTSVQILTYSAAGGVCEEKKLLAPDAKPAPDGFNPEKPECATKVSVSVRYHPDDTSQLFSRVATGTSEGGGDRSFRYRLPAQVRASVGDDKTTYGTSVFSVAQLGKVVSLPAKRNSKSLSYELAMVESTGGLKTFKLGSSGGLDAGTIDALSGATNTAIDARNARRKEKEAEADAAAAAAATASDELTILTRQHALLKLKDEICTLQKKLGLVCTVEP
jgi:hypothetical protein